MYVCSSCGYRSGVSYGKCPGCQEYGTMQAEVAEKTNLSHARVLHAGSGKHDISLCSIDDDEIARVVGPSFVVGGVYMLAGEPGAGKSTMALQLLDMVRSHDVVVGYMSAEETSHQIGQRVERLEIGIDGCVYEAYDVADICATIEHHGISFCIVDSVQTITVDGVAGVAGSPAQVKAVAEHLTRFAKKHHCTLLLIGHVTKGGTIAGPKYLEHIVDVVLSLEGERTGEYKYLRSYKHRFGSTSQTGLFRMTSSGLVAIASDYIYMHAPAQSLPGNVVSIAIDNGRAFPISVEVLLHKSPYKFPQRICSGYDTSRLHVLLAICETYLGVSYATHDVYVNIPGDIPFRDRGLDLAVIVALYEQYHKKVFYPKTICIGEVTLSGTILPASTHPKRVAEVSAGWSCLDYQSVTSLPMLRAS